MGIEKLKDKLFCFNKKAEEKYTIEGSINSSDQQGTLEVHRGQLTPEDYERRKIQYELFETYREIALLRDTDLNGQDDKLLTYVRNVKSVEDAEVKYTAIESLKNQVKSVQVQLAQNMAELRLKLEQINRLKMKIAHLESTAKTNYTTISNEIKLKNERNNEFMLAISQCQVDLIDLRRIVRDRNIHLTQMRTRVKIQASKLEKLNTSQQDNIDVESDDEDLEGAVLANEIAKTNSEISQLRADLKNDSWAKIFEMMKNKLEEDVKDTENEEELARVLKDLEDLTGSGNSSLKLDVDVNIKVQLEADIKLMKAEIDQLKNDINTKKAEIQDNTKKIEQENDLLLATQNKVKDLKLKGDQLITTETTKKTTREVEKMDWEI